MIEALGHIGFGLFGLAVLVSIAVLFSENRRAISWKLVATGIVLYETVRQRRYGSRR